MRRVLVTGGAGYVGSHTVKALTRAGFEPVVVDDLSSGHRAAVRDAGLVVGDFASPDTLDRALRGGPVVAALHFAARCYVGESVREPLAYHSVNLAGTIRLLEGLLARGIDRVVFSSSCAVYGEPADAHIPEERPFAPVSPYGRTKAGAEWALEDLDRAGLLRYAALRYFNAAGADPDGELGEDHRPETHLVPRAIDAALGRGPEVLIHGTDYGTPDGTCVRDYVHVSDLADAHVRAVGALLSGAPSRRLNLGAGRGHSVREVLAAVERACGRPVPARPGPRRTGDPARLVARPGRARTELGWEPSRSSLQDLVATALAWREGHPEGYG